MGNWDPYTHQPIRRGASRSSAVWDSNYNAAAAGRVRREDNDDDDDVAAAVRSNAEELRKHQSGYSAGTRPMSELGGLVSWKGPS